MSGEFIFELVCNRSPMFSFSVQLVELVLLLGHDDYEQLDIEKLTKQLNNMQ